MDRLKIALAVGLLVTAATAARGQVEPGSRVRVKLAKTESKRLAAEVGSESRLGRDLEDDRRVTGTLTTIDDETLALRVEGLDRPLGLRRSAIERLDVSRGRNSRVKSALKGFATGALIALPPAAAAGCDDCFFSTGQAVVGGLVLGGTVGALIGAWAGEERWEPAAHHALTLSLTPAKGHGLGVSVRFGF